MKLRAWMTGCVMGAVVGVQAGPTMLNFIPVADILRHREAMIAYSIYGSEKNIDPTVTHAHAITIGLFDRLEIGYDNDFKGSTTFNAKLLLLEEPEDGKWALSAGIMNWDLYGYSEPYAVARYDLPFCRLHLGAIRDDRWRLIAGVDFPLFGDWSGMIDFKSGPGSYTWFGLSAPIKGIEGLSIWAGVGYPSTRSDGVQWSASLTYVVRF